MYQLYIYKSGIWVQHSCPMSAYDAAMETRRMRDRGFQVQRLPV